MANFSDLPSELIGVIAQFLISAKAYESCGNLNQSCRSVYNATCPAFWHTIDFRFTLKDDDPEYVQEIAYFDGREHRITKPLRRKVRHMLEEVWLKAEACHKYTNYILLPLSLLISGAVEYRVPPRGDVRDLDTSKMVVLKAIVVMEAYCASDGFDIYLGNAFEFGTKDARDVILFCNPDAALDSGNSQIKAEAFPSLEYPSGLNLMVTIDTGHVQDHATSVGNAFSDTFLLMASIDVGLLNLGMSMSESSRLSAEFKTFEELNAFTTTVSIQLDLDVPVSLMFTITLNLQLARATSSSSSYAEIAIDMICHAKPTPEALADVLRNLAGPIWHAQNTIYKDHNREFPGGSLSIACGEDQIMQGRLDRLGEEWYYAKRARGPAGPASTPLQLDVREGDNVRISELRA